MTLQSAVWAKICPSKYILQHWTYVLHALALLWKNVHSRQCSSMYMLASPRHLTIGISCGISRKILICQRWDVTPEWYFWVYQPYNSLKKARKFKPNSEGECSAPKCWNAYKKHFSDKKVITESYRSAFTAQFWTPPRFSCLLHFMRYWQVHQFILQSPISQREPYGEDKAKANPSFLTALSSLFMLATGIATRPPKFSLSQWRPLKILWFS